MAVCASVVLLIELSCGLTAETFVTVSVVIIPDVLPSDFDKSFNVDFP